MSRKNFRTKQARRAQFPDLPVILPSFLADTEDTYAVEVTNGSGRKVVEVYGTKSGAWSWTTEAGKRGGLGAGNWWPVDITPAANLVRSDESESFLLVS